ncbi:MAG: hypothetical protein RLN88_05685 [Ekhidna sp.]|uniref:hypothetical protein n=1 Tax=Ekhidna sp. TaxID=2608089 RepID=UPI0032EE9FD2
MVFKKDLDLQKDWVSLLYKIKEVTGKRPADLNSVLFLIGVQELGKGAKSFSKEEKQDVMHIAICKVLSLAGYYQLEGLDEEGWPHWKLIKKLPRFDLLEQEKLLKIQILEYFKEEIGW